MSRWFEYEAEEVLKGKDANGNRLISSFARDYKQLFGTSICPSCNDFKDRFRKYQLKIKEMENTEIKSVYKLKKTYQNIPLSFGSSIYVNDNNITDEIAEKLLNEHPRGKELFDIVPDTIVPDNNLSIRKRKLLKNNRNKLMDIATELGLQVEGLNKKELVAIIIEEQS